MSFRGGPFREPFLQAQAERPRSASRVTRGSSVPAVTAQHTHPHNNRNRGASGAIPQRLRQPQRPSSATATRTFGLRTGSVQPTTAEAIHASRGPNSLASAPSRTASLNRNSGGAVPAPPSSSRVRAQSDTAAAFALRRLPGRSGEQQSAPIRRGPMRASHALAPSKTLGHKPTWEHHAMLVSPDDDDDDEEDDENVCLDDEEDGDGGSADLTEEDTRVETPPAHVGPAVVIHGATPEKREPWEPNQPQRAGSLRRWAATGPECVVPGSLPALLLVTRSLRERQVSGDRLNLDRRGLQQLPCVVDDDQQDPFPQKGDNAPTSKPSSANPQAVTAGSTFELLKLLNLQNNEITSLDVRDGRVMSPTSNPSLSSSASPVPEGESRQPDELVQQPSQTSTLQYRPVPLMSYKAIVFLDLYNNKIHTIGRAFVGVDTLRVLMMGSNCLTSIAELEGCCPQLDVLDVHNNLISKIGPSALSHMKQLRICNISGNRLTKLDAFGHSNVILQEVNARRNRIARIAPTIAQCKQLARLYLSSNHLAGSLEACGLDRSVFLCSGLTELSIEQNAICTDAMVNVASKGSAVQPSQATMANSRRPASAGARRQTQDVSVQPATWREMLLTQMPTLAVIDSKKVNAAEREAIRQKQNLAKVEAMKGASPTAVQAQLHPLRYGPSSPTMRGGQEEERSSPTSSTTNNNRGSTAGADNVRASRVSKAVADAIHRYATELSRTAGAKEAPPTLDPSQLQRTNEAPPAANQTRGPEPRTSSERPSSAAQPSTGIASTRPVSLPTQGGEHVLAEGVSVDYGRGCLTIDSEDPRSPTNGDRSASMRKTPPMEGSLRFSSSAYEHASARLPAVVNDSCTTIKLVNFPLAVTSSAIDDATARSVSSSANGSALLSSAAAETYRAQAAVVAGSDTVAKWVDAARYGSSLDALIRVDIGKGCDLGSVWGVAGLLRMMGAVGGGCRSAASPTLSSAEAEELSSPKAKAVRGVRGTMLRSSVVQDVILATGDPGLAALFPEVADPDASKRKTAKERMQSLGAARPFTGDDAAAVASLGRGIVCAFCGAPAVTINGHVVTDRELKIGHALRRYLETTPELRQAALALLQAAPPPPPRMLRNASQLFDAASQRSRSVFDDSEFDSPSTTAPLVSDAPSTWSSATGDKGTTWPRVPVAEPCSLIRSRILQPAIGRAQRRRHLDQMIVDVVALPMAKAAVEEVSSRSQPQ